MMRKSVWLAAAFMAVALGTPERVAVAQGFELQAGSAYMVEFGSGTRLFARNPDARFAPASLAKLMTLEYVFNEIAAERLSLDATFAVSENAWRTGGAPSRTSTMFAELNSRIRVEDLLRGIMIQAANDGCIVVAEGLSGSEAAFAEKLNARAAEIGLTDSRFVNSTGLPADGQHTTVRDMVRLATHLIDSYPDLYPIFAEEAFTWNGIFQRNRNPLLTLGIDADGLAIGFTDGEGFSLVGSVERDGRRVVAALGGLPSASVRSEEARRLLDWGIRGFNKSLIFEPGEIVGSVQLFGGEKSSLSVRSASPVHVLIPADNRERITARIVYDGPIAAPVVEGAPVGMLRIWIGETMTQETPLVSAETVGVGTLTQRATDAVVELLTGWIRLI